MTSNVTFVGVKLTVEYNYSPEQKQTYDDPGFDESFEVIGVHTEHGDDVLAIFELKDIGHMLEDKVAEDHRDRYADEY